MPNITSSERPALPNYWFFSSRTTDPACIGLNNNLLAYCVCDGDRSVLNQLNTTRAKAWEA